MQTRIVTRDDPDRQAVETMIRAVYFNRYGAWIDLFPDRLAAAFDSERNPVCAAGLRDAVTGFFSEAYINDPVEHAIAGVSGYQPDRDSVLEVTTLAGIRSGYVLQLLGFIMTDATRRGMTWGLFTATQQLRLILKRIRAPIFELAAADSARIANAALWGSYYTTDPRVCAIAGPASGMTQAACSLLSDTPARPLHV
ncbi:MAG: thermostable hemolysin [Alphaproteobacteria bacterium]